MTEQQLKDTIIAQAVRIAELEEELASENWMSNYYRQECSELRDKIAKLKEELGEAYSTVAEAVGLSEQTQDEYDRLAKAIGLTSEPEEVETPFADLTVEDLEATND